MNLNRDAMLAGHLPASTLASFVFACPPHRAADYCPRFPALDALSAQRHSPGEYGVPNVHGDDPRRADAASASSLARRLSGGSAARASLAR